jgi:ABC-type multidrug transport system fused ATPase/permease subunit
MLATVSVVIVRYRLTLYPALAFLAFVIFRIFQQLSRVPGGSVYDAIPPTLIAAGLILMSSALGRAGTWNSQFWAGETLVIGMFLYNSLSFLPLQNRFVSAGLVVISLLLALLFRGSWWNYAVVLGLIVFFAVIVALAFPIMELVLEAILNEKLKKVGDKVRHHHQVLRAHYEKKANR